MFTRRNFLRCSLAASGALLAGCAPAATGGDKPRVAVVAFSYTGNTRAAAEMIARHYQAPRFEIVPATAYPADYTACTEQAKAELARGFLPPLASAAPDPATYDVLFVGSPNWWGTVAPPVRTFLAQSAFTRGKRVVPFFTHGGGGMQRCEADFAALVPEAQQVLPGATFSGYSIHRAEAEVSAWLTSLRL